MRGLKILAAISAALWMVTYSLVFRVKFELFNIWAHSTPTSTCDALSGYPDMHIQCLKYYGSFTTWWGDYGHTLDLFCGLLLPPLALTLMLGLASWAQGRFIPAAD